MQKQSRYLAKDIQQLFLLGGLVARALLGPRQWNHVAGLSLEFELRYAILMTIKGQAWSSFRALRAFVPVRLRPPAPPSRTDSRSAHD
jgi:hypothetical protein